MKINKILWLFMVILVGSCSAQNQILKKKGNSILNQTSDGMVIDTKGREDVIITDVKGGSTLSFHFKDIKDGSHFLDLSPQSTSLMDLRNKNNKLLYFYNNETKMRIDCNCPMLNNYYIKNLKIEAGNYKLTYKKVTKIKGNQIKVSDNIQNLLFKNVRATESSNPKNIYFKNLEFKILDLSDTLNVKLEKVN